MCDFSQYGIPSDEWLRVEASLPPRKNLPIPELKQSTNLTRESIAQNDMKELSRQVSLQDYSIPTRDGQHVEARLYRPATLPTYELLPIYIHFHGGGFLFGTLGSEDAICSRIAIQTESAVVNVNYRHTPEFRYPTAWNDAEDALAWVCNHSRLFYGDTQKLVIGGVSAGAWLTASLVQAVVTSELKLSPEPNILGQVLMIPCLVFRTCYDAQLRQIKNPSVSSYQQANNAPILNEKTRKMFNDLLQIENPDPEDRRLNPGLLTAGEAKLLPPTTVGVAGYDPLRDEGLLYGKILAENGVPTNINVFRGVPHGFRRFGEKLSVCKDWDRVVEDGIRWAWSKPSADEFTIKEF
ncbi:Alpha/Beta hydrolase protein [Talaromyces proteolyticus]|uniref:Alpha/Beta hydrolase protein n=1 Tax=Talaromyces proteolyticus TaxID=1131652 RepID=A0AAD4KMW4_9EURO|nr:Alpha/Beta hydrolase protein [Talaromyces proteolyticus]KAH8695550.1 Alpha/Beta hydrolase protein [Talaromyces proteolyticus]